MPQSKEKSKEKENQIPPQMNTRLGKTTREESEENSLWCPNCQANTEHRMTKESVTRMNPDDGTYPEHFEIPTCVLCNGEMLDVARCKVVLTLINLVLLLVWLGVTAILFTFFPINFNTCTAFTACTSLLFFLSLTPNKYRKNYEKWKEWKDTTDKQSS
tara:strand:+ start:616 stop:1092 length:477 start_codon:yes stop_codon:yes gene_type:complete